MLSKPKASTKKVNKRSALEMDAEDLQVLKKANQAKWNKERNWKSLPEVSKEETNSTGNVQESPELKNTLSSSSSGSLEEIDLMEYLSDMKNEILQSVQNVQDHLQILTQQINVQQMNQSVKNPATTVEGANKPKVTDFTAVKKKYGLVKKEGANKGKFFSIDVNAQNEDIPNTFRIIDHIETHKEAGKNKEGQSYTVLKTPTGENISGTYEYF